jgi:hypothetical protein
MARSTVEGTTQALNQGRIRAWRVSHLDHRETAVRSQDWSEGD